MQSTNWWGGHVFWVFSGLFKNSRVDPSTVYKQNGGERNQIGTAFLHIWTNQIAVKFSFVSIAEWQQ